MSTVDFQEQVKSELQRMSSEEVVFFAWLCALRTLPYIGAKGNFNYWKKENRQKHLYALFRALDANCYYRAYAGGADITSVILFNIKFTQTKRTCITC